MSRRAQLYADIELARGRPYVERLEEEPGWHDVLALALYRATLAPVMTALSFVQRDMQRIVAAVLAHSEGLAGLSDDALRERAAALRPRLRRARLALADAAECFAVVREAAGRTVGLRHHGPQLMAGYALLNGRLVEMATGEGKTFCATLPACTMALAGFPVHVITVNDYLAERDAQKMRPLYAFFGLGVGAVVQGMERDERRVAYAQAITYSTNKELAFDYLRDRVSPAGAVSRLHQGLQGLDGRRATRDGLVLRGLVFAIVDEADSVFVDEARTPLVLSAQTQQIDEIAHSKDALALAGELAADADMSINLVERSVTLSEEGRARLDAFAEGRSGPWTSPRAREALLCQALSALHLFRRDQHYVVAEGKVQIVDESTGRVMPDRSWERGLHQLIELKESLEPTAQRETLARLTYQRLFRRYVRLAGMTGTAAEAASEIRRVYGLSMARVPLARPSLRVDCGVRVCAGQQDKWHQVAQRVSELALTQGRPVLIGTRSVQASEQISEVLTHRGIAHVLLNAKQDADEASVIAAAGQAGRVTVATNMAGRGTDIELAPGVVASGGLHVILTEFHESRRVDRQLMGRCARQGDPGSCEAIVSLDDELFEVYAPWLSGQLARLLGRGVQPSGNVIRLLRLWAQWSAERRYASIRLQNLKLDRQLNEQLAFTGKGE